MSIRVTLDGVAENRANALVRCLLHAAGDEAHSRARAERSPDELLVGKCGPRLFDAEVEKLLGAERKMRGVRAEEQLPIARPGVGENQRLDLTHAERRNRRREPVGRSVVLTA